jgi:LemA protein
MTILLAILAALFVLGILLFNTLVARKNEVKNSFATIDAMLKKRFDLIPNLVAAVKESAKFETSTLEKVIQMRSQASAGSLTPQQIQKLDAESAGALRSFFVQVEAYPDLKSSQNFAQMQNALQEVEDQLAAARRTYNAAVTNYNNALEMFPTNIVAGILAYKQADLLSIPEAERKNVNVAELFKS